MRLLDRYISKVLTTAIVVVLLFLLALQTFILYVGELLRIGSGNYGLLSAFFYVLLRLPYQLYDFFPIACLIGSLVGLGTLASQSELIAMRAASMSIGHISFTVIKAGCVLALLAAIVGETVGPLAMHYGTQLKLAAINNSSTMDLRGDHEIWLRMKENYLHIAHITNNELNDTVRYQMGENNTLEKIFYAPRVNYESNQWVATNVTVDTIKSSHIFREHFDKQIWDLNLKPSVIPLIDVPPRELSLSQLYHFYHAPAFLTQTTLYALSFWQRLFQPLTTVIMMLVALPFIFGSTRSATMGLRLLIGTCLGLTFYLANQFLGPITVVFHLPPILAALIPSILFTIFAVYRLRKI